MDISGISESDETPTQEMGYCMMLRDITPSASNSATRPQQQQRRATPSLRLRNIEECFAALKDLRARNNLLLEKQTELEEEWSDRHGGVFYADSGEQDPAIDRIRKERGSVGTALARTEHIYERARARRRALVEAITSGVWRQVDGLIMSSMGANMRDVMASTLVTVAHPCARIAFRPVDTMDSVPRNGL